MDHQPHQPNASHRASGLPRPISRLPVPRSGLRHTPSVDNLSQRPALSHSISNPRLRAVPSRDQLSVSSTSSKPRVPSTPSKSREISSGSTGTVIHKTPPKQPFLRRSSSNALFKRSQQSAGAQQTHARPPSRDSSAVIQEDIQEGAELVDKENIAIHGRRKPRLSLSERTMETLQSIPSSPAVQRKSSFFNTENSPMRPPSRASSSSRPSSSHTDKSMRPPYRSVSSRPTSSSGSGLAESIAPDFRASTNTFSPPESTTLQSTPMKRPGTVKSLKTPSSIRSLRAPGSAASKLPSPTSESFFQERSPSPVKTAVKVPTLKSGSKSFSSRQVKPRGSVNGLFREQPMIDLDQPAEIDRIGFGGSNRLPSSFSASSEDTAISSLSPTSSRTNNTSESDDQTVVPRKTSLTLREQIAQAKAAKRAALKNAPSAVSDPQQDMPVMPSGTFDFGLSQDPFNQQIDPNSSKGLLRKRIDSARTDGRLNIAAMGFKEMPEEVLNMYNLEAVSGSWAECVDLTRFIAADNEFEELSVEVFPDVDPRAAVDDDDDGKGNQFGGLETIDLHGNLLKAIPLGFRRLELLTTLNLSNNKLSNDCFEVISQISALRDLKVAGNTLSGALPEGISQLHNLEVLDIQRNTLTSLPKGLADLVKLRVLNLAENQFASLPFDSLCNLPLVELVARKNRLSGTLIEADVKALPHLQILDVTGNSLTNLAISELALPALHQLSCSCNRLTGLPDMSSWDSLLTIAAEDNNISSLPEGFVNLSKVKNVDFSGNDLKMLDDKIGGMESLVIFRISGNPLREKKFAGMATDDLKRALKARMAPVEPEIQDEESIDGEFLSAQSTPSRPSSASDWPVQTGGILDRSNTKSTSLNPVASAQVASNHSIKVLQLHHNNFQEIPASIAFFAATLTTLNLSHNEFTSDTFLKDELELPALKELDLSANTFSSLQPLMQRLIAPQLERLDISFNRLTSLPVLRTHFPNLTTVLASNNTIRELSPEAVKGLRVLDCNSNDLSSLNARLGLLGGPGGLQRLDVRGNRFRVPKYTVLDKGTEATLAWLRDRIPAGETSMNDVD